MNRSLFFFSLIFLVVFPNQSFANIYGPKLKYTKLALIIGVSKYGKETGWRDISCENDIIHLNKALRNSGFAEGGINILRDSLATKAGILSAFEKIVINAKPGDIIFIHFSGHGQQIKDDNNDEKDSLDECLVPYDAPLYLNKRVYAGERHIRDDELIALLNKIREKIGPGGQLVFTTDASHSGPDEDPSNLRNSPKNPLKISGRGGIFDEIKNSSNPNANLSPFIAMASCLNTEIGWETMDENGAGIGVFTYSFCLALEKKMFNEYKSYQEFFDSIKYIARKLGPRQHPAIAGDIQELVFTSRTLEVILSNKVSKPKTNCYVISIGINAYKTASINIPATQNTVSDATLFSDFVKRSFKNYASDTSRIISILLTNKNATAKDIIDSINKVIILSKPDDYFIFNFAGITRAYSDSNGQSITYFFPSDLKDVFDSVEIKKKAISLIKLKNLLDLIPANNQLVITEAGSTANFQREFLKILIENSPTISSITKRNRIIIVPGSFGRDDFICSGTKIESGPLNYFITRLKDNTNIFDLFIPENRDEIVRQIIKNEMDCNFSNTIYSQIFFERKYIEDLQYLLPESLMKSRGAMVINEDKKVFRSKIQSKHALILGTNIYGGKPQWNDLANAEIDAIEIAKQLEKSYGFKTKLLLNPNQDTLYATLFKYSQTLDTNDQLLIFFAGHGDFDEKYFDDGFIVLNNSATTKNDPYRKTYIQHSELQRMINKLPPKQILVILDVCFGGTFDSRVIKTTGRNKNDDYTNIESSDFISSKLKYKTRVYITSGGKKEVPDGYKGKHSPFALKLLEALRTEGGNNGFLTASEIFAFVQRLPSGPLMGDFGDHQIGGEFMLVPQK